MFKTFKEWLEAKGVNDEAYGKKTAEEMGALQKEYMQYVSEETKKALEGSAKKADITEAIKGLAKEDSMKDFVKSGEIDSLKQLVQEATEKANQALEKGNDNSSDPLAKAAAELKENKEAIKAIATRQSTKEVVIKALTLRTSVATNTIGFDLPGIGQFGRKARTFYEFLSKQVIPLPSDHAGIIRYRDWDEATTVKAAAAVAEGAAFPESTAKWKGYTLPIEKIGDTLPVTEEFFEDEPTAAAELNLFLQSNVLDKVDTDIVLADGVSPNLKSIDSEATAFTAAASGITDSNIFDLMVKVQEDIEKNNGSKYMVNFFLLNVADYNKLVLKKDANNNYVFDRELREMPWQILVDNNVVANTMYAGDSRYVRVYEQPGVALSTGMVGTQFTEDELTLKARKRLAFLIRNVDKTGFRKVASISAALTTLAS